MVQTRNYEAVFSPSNGPFVRQLLVAPVTWDSTMTVDTLYLRSLTAQRTGGWKQERAGCSCPSAPWGRAIGATDLS